MPRGLLIDLNDGGKPMEITANLRCPSFGVEFDEAVNQPLSKTIPNFYTGSDVIFLPKQTVYINSLTSSGVPNLYVLTSVTNNGPTVTQTVKKSNESSVNHTFAGSAWQIFPASTGGRTAGLLISNSTDFLSITDATQVGVCIWKGTVTIPTGGWSTPAIAGYDRSKYLIFAKWDSSVVIDYDGSTVRAFNVTDADDSPGTATLNIVIFASGVAPTPGTGLNIFNAAGKCVFSTTRRPFIFDGSMWTPTFTPTPLGGRYIMLGRYGLYSSLSNGRYNIKTVGLRMSGGAVSCIRGKYIGWNDIQLINNTLTSVKVPVLPDMYL
ncbi:DUF6453 family protein (plasmid) [Pseudomonas marginalis]|uniref:DUF6453 family protein n=1 Tax=Pseudomonas marginalis TaxID=298 RepID=UPI003864B481